MGNRKTPDRSTKSVRSTVAYAEVRGESPPRAKGDKPADSAEEAKPGDDASPAEALNAAEGAKLVESSKAAARTKPDAAASAPASPQESDSSAVIARPDAEAPGAAGPGAVAGAAVVAAAVPTAPSGDAPASAELAALPAPDAIVHADPHTPAPPPGHVPAGDSRSLRRRRDATDEFALVYRHENHLITRIGEVGTTGEWRDVEYPTIAAAAHAYAMESSRLVADGFHDYR